MCGNLVKKAKAINNQLSIDKSQIIVIQILSTVLTGEQVQLGKNSWGGFSEMGGTWIGS